MARTPPFNGFSRGIPIVGQSQKPPAGAYFYEVPALIRREGQPLDADSYEVRVPAPLEGVRFKALAGQLASALHESAPDLPAPKLILLAPIFLGFVPQEVLEAQAAAANDGAADGEGLVS